MNEKEFEAAIAQVGSLKMNLSFQTKWHTETIKTLATLSKQKAGITHPRHRGDAREDDFLDVLRSSTPPGLRLEKGIAVNVHGFQSPEQDCLVFGADSTPILAEAGQIKYVPIDSVLSSIEIKSKLTLSELRKSICSLATLKTLPYFNFDYSALPPSGNRILSVLFAYESDLSITDLAAKMSELNKNVPPQLRINMVYVLNEGLVVTKREGYSLAAEDFVETNGDYTAIARLSKEPQADSSAAPFLVLIAAIVDHAIAEFRRRKPPRYRDIRYVADYLERSDCG